MMEKKNTMTCSDNHRTCWHKPLRKIMKLKLLHFLTNSTSLQNESIDSRFTPFIFWVIIKASFGMFSFSLFLMKSAVSLMYVCCSITNGCRKKSTCSEIFSTGQLLAEMIGLAFVGGFEWILLSRNNSNVLVFFSRIGDRYLRVFSLMFPQFKSSVNVSWINWETLFVTSFSICI